MADFAKYFPLLVENEGGYVFDPHDQGGETWRGVARNYHPHWTGWTIVDKYKAKSDWPTDCGLYPRNELATNILKKDPQLAAEVQSFYLPEYWNCLDLSGVNNQSIASQLCDIGVNSGTGRVGHMAQYVLATFFGWHGVIDGAIGPATLAAINAAPAKAYYDALVALRRDFYLYRAGLPIAPPGVVSFLESVNVKPNKDEQRYLHSWLSRISAIPYVA
ncbi:glycosyl hydrolase 108 family protein [Hymenobacter lucidus]|uniref:TtsA-like Glycoside hydrolase family 108 domain-containing protein n=1 Tax=Hymenobacter lucidus TaxID=2880930 RepID=A0ABS8AMJ8_9BACT|nr:glycosyl hydrolase 108 family protein [Hymenobacter lucidus]MCB2407445.1 hypothetical protein [Hymenobacter lucidus]